MILPQYRIGPSSIPGAGQGVFAAERIAAGRVIVAPDAIPRVHHIADVHAMPNAEAALAACVRWFEDRFTVTPEWPDECYLNHGFDANGLWHLGFVFAAREISVGEEILIDYRHLLDAGQEEVFLDAQTGTRIVGWSWADSLRRSSAELAKLAAAMSE